MRRFRCLPAGQRLDQPLRFLGFRFVAAFQRHILLLGHELIHIALIQAVIQAVAALERLFRRIQPALQRRGLLFVLWRAVHPADNGFHIGGKGDLGLNGLQKHGEQCVLPDVFQRTAANVVGVGRTDEGVPQLFFVAHILVPYQRTLAVGAVDQPLEDVFGGFQMREPAELFKVLFALLLCKSLNLIKGFPVNKRLVGVFHNDPVLFGRSVLPPVFVEGLPLPALHHVSDVHLPGQKVFDRLNIPAHAVILLCFAYTGIVQVGGGGWYALIVEPPCDLRDAHALGSPPEYLPDDGSRRFVRFQLVGIILTLAVAVGSPRPDEIAVFLLRRQCGAGLSGNILAVNLVNKIFQRNEIPVRAPPGGEGVEAVVDGNEAHAQKRKNAFQIVAGLLVVSAKAG